MKKRMKLLLSLVAAVGLFAGNVIHSKGFNPTSKSASSDDKEAVPAGLHPSRKPITLTNLSNAIC